MAAEMTEVGAIGILRVNGITRLLKSYAAQPSYLKPAIIALLDAILTHAERVIDIPTLVSVALSPFT
jgi:hypothetical protein